MSASINTNSLGKASEGMDPSADHVRPPASQAATGSGSANTGGGHETVIDDANTNHDTRIDGQTSLAAREGEKSLHSNSHSPAAQPHAPAKAGAASPSRAAPAAIPDDIREVATHLAATYAFDVHGLLVGAIAAALLSERQKEQERCVQRWVTYCSIQTEHGNHLGWDLLVGGTRAIRSNQEGKG